jgi:hypothetical protein
MLRIQDMSESRIQRLEQDLTRADLEPRSIAAIPAESVQGIPEPVITWAAQAQSGGEPSRPARA